MKFILKADIPILILLFFLLRLYGITNPPLERNHNWRQATTNMYARNFLEVDNNILYARVDMAGDLTGITAKEFPLFNYLIYLAAELFGWQHWYGRLINLLVSSLGVCFFYLLVKKNVDDKRAVPPSEKPFPTLALPAALLLLCSIWFGHSRIIMPDTFSVSLVLAALYFGLGYVYQGKGWRLLLFFMLGTAGSLSKLPSSFLLAVLLFPLFHKEVAVDRKLWLAGVGAAMLAISGGWYFYWLPFIVKTYGFEHYPMRTFWEGAKEIMADLPETAERFYVSALKSYLAFTLYMAGVILIFLKRHRWLLPLFSLLSAVFLLFMFKSGASFYHHNYYIIPFVPVMAFLAAYAWSHIPLKWLRILLLLAIAMESVANQQDAFHIRPSEMAKLELETIADSLGSRSDLVAFYSEDGNPQELYFSHRKGWLSTKQELLAPDYLHVLKTKGCRLVFVNKKNWGAGDWPPISTVFENDAYRVFVMH